MAVPTVVAVATVNDGSGDNFTINKPTGTADGDVMYAQMFQEANNPTFGAPAGWSAITANQLTPSDNDTGRIYRKVASGEGASYAFTSSNAATVVGGIISIRGADTTTPEDATTTIDSNAASVPTNPSITTVTPECLLLLFAATTGNTTRTHPSGSTEQWDFGNGGGGGTAVFLATKDAVAVGATGSNAWSTSGQWIAATIAVRSANPSTGYKPRLALLGVG